MDGGAARNDLLLELLADRAGVEVERPASPDSAVLGAAYLAGRAIGIWTDEDVEALFAADRSFEPGIDGAERDELRAQWERRVALVREAGL